jgi:ADP-glucose pyrophosphorylase
VQIAEGASLERCLVLDGAVIEKPIKMREVLVFPNVRVKHEGELTRAIITKETEIFDNEAAQP